MWMKIFRMQRLLERSCKFFYKLASLYTTRKMAHSKQCHKFVEQGETARTLR